MFKLVGQPIIVENKPGAATNLGADFVANASPDGYTMLLGDVATYVANPSLYKKLPFDPSKDFAPVTLTARFLSDRNKLKVNSVAELIDQAKREPGKIDIAHAEAPSTGAAIAGSATTKRDSSSCSPAPPSPSAASRTSKSALAHDCS